MKKFKRLKKWENSLNACIRCGYCYEHCPIFKNTRWETDAPRAKLILAYGLLQGEVKLTDYLAEKLFECFYCGQCQKACSSGVPLLDVFDDIRRDLLDAGVCPLGTTSITDHDQCVQCLNCVRLCPHEARAHQNSKIETDPLKCQSCGSCLDVCSAAAIRLSKGYGTNPDEMLQKVQDVFNRPDQQQPKVIVFSCNWSSFPGLQTAEFNGHEEARPYSTLVTACSGRLKTIAVMEALKMGAWGALVCACPEDDCDHGGAARAKERMLNLSNILEQVGIDPKRVQVACIPKNSPKDFIGAVDEFVDQVKQLGPLFERQS